LHSDASRLRDDLEKSRGQIASLRKELKNATASADAQASELTQTFEYERRCREQAEADVASLQTEVAHLKSQLKAATKQLEESHLREQTVSSTYLWGLHIAELMSPLDPSSL
jgi:predicted  nucleic acid-binding Zn-ribbon protein